MKDESLLKGNKIRFHKLGTDFNKFCSETMILTKVYVKFQAWFGLGILVTKKFKYLIKKVCASCNLLLCVVK